MKIRAGLFLQLKLAHMGMQPRRLRFVCVQPCLSNHETLRTGLQISSGCHLRNRKITVHGLDFGIHAEMTAFLAWLDLCITARAGAWERASILGNLSQTPNNPSSNDTHSPITKTGQPAR